MSEDWQTKDLTKEQTGDDNTRDTKIRDKLYLVRKLKALGVKHFKDETMEILFADEILFASQPKIAQNNTEIDKKDMDFMLKSVDHKSVERELFNL